MASTRNVVVNFVTKLSGRGIDNFSKQSRGLDRSLDRLQKRLVALVSFGAFFRFIKNSTKAFAQETGEVRQLELALNNLGLAYTSLTIEDTIASLQRLTAVSDGELRPALAQLVRQTADVTKATELLELAINVSLGSGKSLATVSRALGRAYDGQTTALRRLDAGLSAAAIESKDFNKIQAELQDKFGGAAAADLDTYAGKMRALAVASDEAREKIGEGVVKGIEALGRGDFQQGLNDLVTLAEKIGRGFEIAGRGVARLRAFLSAPIGRLGDQAALTGRFLSKDIALDAAERKAQIADVDRRYKLERKALKELAIQKEKERAKEKSEDRRKAATKAAEKRQDELKKRLEEKFDIDAINLQAALSRQLSDEDKARVKALQAIRTETATDDEASLNRLIELERKRTQDSIVGSSLVKSQRLSDLEAELQALLKLASARIGSITGSVPSTGVAAPSLTGETALEAYNLGARNLGVAGGAAFLDFLFSGETVNPTGVAPLNATAPSGGAGVVIIQNIQGSVVTEQELFDKFQDELFQSNRAGIPGQLELLGR